MSRNPRENLFSETRTRKMLTCTFYMTATKDGHREVGIASPIWHVERERGRRVQNTTRWCQRSKHPFGGTWMKPPSRGTHTAPLAPPRATLHNTGSLGPHCAPMVILVRATTRLWAPEAIVLVAKPKATSGFQNLLARSALHTSTAVQQQKPGVGAGGRVAQELRPYATIVPAAERLVVIGDVHGDIGEACFMCIMYKSCAFGVLRALRS